MGRYKSGSGHLERYYLKGSKGGGSADKKWALFILDSFAIMKVTGIGSGCFGFGGAFRDSYGRGKSGG